MRKTKKGDSQSSFIISLEYESKLEHLRFPIQSHKEPEI